MRARRLTRRSMSGNKKIEGGKNTSYISSVLALLHVSRTHIGEEEHARKYVNETFLVRSGAICVLNLL
jgi:hypothetical protein